MAISYTPEAMQSLIEAIDTPVRIPIDRTYLSDEKEAESIKKIKKMLENKKLEYNQETMDIIDKAIRGEDLNYVEDIEQLRKELEED